MEKLTNAMTLKYNTELLKSITDDELNEVGQYMLDAYCTNPDMKALQTTVSLSPDENILVFYVNWSIGWLNNEENWKVFSVFSLTQINYLIEKGIVYGL